MQRRCLSTFNWSHSLTGALGGIAVLPLGSSTPKLYPWLGSSSSCWRPPDFPSCSPVPLAHPARLLHYPLRPDRVPRFPSALGTTSLCSGSLWVVSLAPPPVPPPHYATILVPRFPTPNVLHPGAVCLFGSPDPRSGVVCLFLAFLIHRLRFWVLPTRSLERVHRGPPGGVWIFSFP